MLEAGNDCVLLQLHGQGVPAGGTTGQDEEYENKVGWGHSAVGQVVALADRAKVKKLFLFHHDLDQTDDDIDAKLETAQSMLKKRKSATLCVAPKEKELFKI